MVVEDVSKFIKDVRKKNNLTQKQLADKLGVTYQAVSKWENGKNIPDIETLKTISDIFNVNIDEIVGNKSKKQKKKIIIWIIIFIITILLVFSLFIIKKSFSSFEFKEISTTCNDFKITGSAAYNKKNSSIYVSSIEFCGKNDKIYKSLECNLFEEYNNTKVRISSYEKMENINIKQYLQNIKFMVNNYSSICKNFKTSKLYIEIDAVDKSNNITTYKIPIKIKNDCE